MTMNYYSYRAYDHLNKELNNLLPSNRTICQWYSNYDGAPGFSMDSIIKMKSHDLFWGLLFDEISIKKCKTLKNDKVFGCVNLGANVKDVDPPLATNAFFIMAS